MRKLLISNPSINTKGAKDQNHAKMGYDMMAYLDISQEAVDDIIKKGNFNKTDYEGDDTRKIADAYKARFLPDFPYDLYYDYNEKCNRHEIHASYPTSFIRDDERFDNRRWIKMMEEKTGEEFPYVLESINYAMRTRENALTVANGIRTFFQDKDDFLLQRFADWCEKTAEVCSTYELSY